MTRVCVTWDREETARLVARCREALAVSDETAKAATEPTWMGYVLDDGQCELFAGPIDEHGYRTGSVLKVDPDDENSYGPSPADMTFIEQNDPSTRLALNRALTAVLDGIAATLGDGYQSRYEDVEHAQASLAAIAAALGQEEGRGKHLHGR